MGGGNHFLDAVSDAEGRVCFVIHTGSRDEGDSLPGLLDKQTPYEAEFTRTVDWARDNRKEIAAIVGCHFPGLELVLDLTHNDYERIGAKILIRKGAVRLLPGGTALIPSSMDGDMALVRGTGRMEEILNSMSHGTGRLMSRGDSKDSAREYDFASLRKRIHIPARTSDRSILTENPSCYRQLDDCLGLLDGFVEVERRLTPIAYIGHV